MTTSFWENGSTHIHRKRAAHGECGALPATAYHGVGSLSAAPRALYRTILSQCNFDAIATGKSSSQQPPWGFRVPTHSIICDTGNNIIKKSHRHQLHFGAFCR